MNANLHGKQKLKKTFLLCSFLFSTLSFANDDIPVQPINKERIKQGPMNGLDSATLDAIAKAMPTIAPEPKMKKVALQSPARAMFPQNVDAYGMAAPQVKITVEDTPKNDLVAGGYEALSNVVAAVARRDPVTDKLKKKYTPHQEVTLKPGYSEMIPVAVGLQNRIATPFNDIIVKTSDKTVVMERDGGYLYITPVSQSPIGIMLGEEGMPETMVSLTLMPLDVPPVMVDLNVKFSKAMKRKQLALLNEKDTEEKHRKHQSEIMAEPLSNDPRVQPEHVDRVTDLLSLVAAGDIPPGFDLTTVIPEEERFPCDIRRMGMYHEVGQRLVSGREMIDIVRIKNDINGFRAVREEHCLADDVIAVAVFDRATLAPGEDTELYILRDKLHAEKLLRVRRRPRLTSTY